MPDYRIGTKDIGFEGHPLREFVAKFAGYEVVGGKPGQNDRFILRFSELDKYLQFMKSQVPYPFPVTQIEVPYPTEEQVRKAMGIPPRSSFGIFMSSLDVLYPEGTSLDALRDSGAVLRMVAEEREIKQKDAEGNETGEVTKFLVWKAASLSEMPTAPTTPAAQPTPSVPAATATPATGGVPADPKEALYQEFVGLFTKPMNATEISQVYMNSPLKGKLDSELFNLELLPLLVSRGMLVLGADEKYSKPA